MSGPERGGLRAVAVIPALDEEVNVEWVIRGIAPHVDRVVLVDNGSTDHTAEVARAAGAEVVSQPERGYGAACLAGIERAQALGAHTILFLDADGSDDPSDAPALLFAVGEGGAELALGVRTRALTEPGAMTQTQRWGNWLAPRLLRLTGSARCSDLSPFKAVRAEALSRLSLRERGHGFTIQLLIEAHAKGLSTVELPVRCRLRRGGQSKVSGTLRGTLRASARILAVIGRHAFR